MQLLNNMKSFTMPFAKWYTACLFGFIFSVIVACDSSSDSSSTSPTNLTLNISVVGTNGQNLYGDGSGVVNFTANANDAVSYGFIIDNEVEQSSLGGSFQYIFNDVEGIENHEITVLAYSSSNSSTDQTKTIPVAYYNGIAPTWADEFFESGSIDTTKWVYDPGTPNNNEEQIYTTDQSNINIENGVLKITAIKSGSGYTSGRITTQNVYDFTYGTVEVRAKLPASQGTWPAIWMLGANFSTVGWPACGEIDIMEQLGWDKNKVLGTCHWSNSGNYAGYGLETSIANATTSFHIYKFEWTQGGAIRFFLDGTQFFVMTTNSSMPFNKDFFFILNVALGGDLGGTIDPNFTQDTMEIDYIRVYQ